MGEARRKPTAHLPTMSPAARELLVAIAQSQRAAICVKEVGDDDLPGTPGNFVLLYPSGKMCVASTDFMLRAAMAFFRSRRFEVGKSPPKARMSDISRAEKLVGEMRLLLSHTDVVPPPNYEVLANNGAGTSPDAPFRARVIPVARARPLSLSE